MLSTKVGESSSRMLECWKVGSNICKLKTMIQWLVAMRSIKLNKSRIRLGNTTLLVSLRSDCGRQRRAFIARERHSRSRETYGKSTRHQSNGDYCYGRRMVIVTRFMMKCLSCFPIASWHRRLSCFRAKAPLWPNASVKPIAAIGAICGGQRGNTIGYVVSTEKSSTRGILSHARVNFVKVLGVASLTTSKLFTKDRRPRRNCKGRYTIKPRLHIVIKMFVVVRWTWARSELDARLPVFSRARITIAFGCLAFMDTFGLKWTPKPCCLEKRDGCWFAE